MNIRTSHTQVRSLPAQAGVTIMMVIAFMGIFLLIMGTIMSYAFQESKYGRALYDREQALHIAESGLEYYRWFLSHNPNDLTNGTGQAGPYTYVVNDPEGGEVGRAYISVVGNTSCNVIQSIDITSVGKSNLNPGFPRTLFARYMRPSVATYSYLLNSNVWAGSDRNITGRYHSNGGVRMDGTNNSDVSSAVSTWSCTSSYGCSPTATQPGVWGSGSGSVLWSYPAASVDFNGIATSLASMKTYAQTGGGLYFGAASGAVTSRGYHVVLLSNGTMDVYRVTGTTGVYGSVTGSSFVTEYNIIASQTFVGNYAIPAACSLVFFDDRVWIEGVVKSKVTIVAATPSDAGTSPDVIIPNNITYATSDGAAGLTVIAERNILIPLNSPDVMEIHGIFSAHSGYYGRNYYTTSGTYDVPSAYDSYVMQTQLTTAGTIVSAGRTGTKWTCGGTFCSGYGARVDAYDELQAASPPPFTPASSPDYSFVLWREQ